MCDCLKKMNNTDILSTKKYQISFSNIEKVEMNKTKLLGFGILFNNEETGKLHAWKFNNCPWCGEKINI